MNYELSLFTEQEKYIALQQHLQNDFFIFEFDDKAYIIEGCTEKELKEEYSELDEEQPFLVWITDRYFYREIPEIEDYSEINDYRVLTDEEADLAYDDCLDQYIEECVLSQIPEHLRCYFDNDSYKDDCKQDGRGNSLSPYDGYENYESVNDNTYYIYRQN